MRRGFAIAALVLPLGCSLLASADGFTGGGEEPREAGVLDGLGPPSDGGVTDGSPACNANVATDPENCGACNHSCKGTACDDGLCRPLALATNLGQPTCVAVDPSGVYWTEQNAARSVLKSGGAARTLRSPSGTYKACRLNNGVFHFTGTFGWYDVTTDDTDYHARAGGGPRPDGVAFATTTNIPVFTETASGCLLTCLPTSGCANQTFDTLQCGLPGPFGIAGTNDAVYVTMQSGGSVVKVDPSGITTLVSGESGPGRIAVDSDAIYWANQGGRIMKAGLDGGAPTVLAEYQDAPTGITLDETSVYWATANGGTVVRVAKSGGAPLTLAKNQDQAWDVAVDVDSVYWVTRVADGGLYRTAK